MAVYKSSPVWTMSTDDVLAHIASLSAPDQIYWDSRSLKYDGKKFQKADWAHWPRATKDASGNWCFVDAATPVKIAPVKQITPDWQAITPGKPDGKISIGGEAFWVTVKSFESGLVTAKINNDLICGDEHGLKFGDVVQFSYLLAPIEALARIEPLPAVVVASKPLVAAETVIEAMRDSMTEINRWIVDGAQHPAPAPVQAAKDKSGAGWSQFVKLARLTTASNA